jgi:hypothetical protein
MVNGDTSKDDTPKDGTPADGSFIEKNGYLVPNDTNIMIEKAQSSDILETRMSLL